MSRKVSPQISVVRIDWEKEKACLPFMDSMATREEMELQSIELGDKLRKKFGKRYTTHVVAQADYKGVKHEI